MTAENKPENLETKVDAEEIQTMKVDQEDLGVEQMGLDELEQQLNNVLEENAQLKDALLRAKAETENIRRRSQEEVNKAHKFGIENFAESLLAVKDSLEAALSQENQTHETWKEGVELTHKQLLSAFERNKLIEIAPATGDAFDPNLHQAISAVPAEGQASNTVVMVLQKGALIADRVLRPALVTVAA